MLVLRFYISYTRTFPKSLYGPLTNIYFGSSGNILEIHYVLFHLIRHSYMNVLFTIDYSIKHVYTVKGSVNKICKCMNLY